MEKIDDYNNFTTLIRLFVTRDLDQLDLLSKDLDWYDIFSEFKKHSITTLAIDFIDDIPMPNEVKQQWKNDILMQTSHYFNLLHVQNDINDCLSTKKINWAILKGTSASLYYYSPLQRAIGDIDILVKEKDFDCAKNALSDAGFKFGKNIYKYDRHFTARKNGVEIELHRFFAETQNRKNDVLLNNTLFDALANSVQTKMFDTSFNTLPEVENGIVFIEHIWHHLSTGIGLRHILDFVLYTEKVLNDDFWNNNFMDVARLLGYDILCKAVARIGQLYFGTDNSIMWCKDIDDSIANELLELILCQGNFGNKSTKEFNPTIRVFNKTHEGLRSFLKYEQASGIKNWNAAQKHKILRPFGWIYGLTRHAFMVLTSKENIANLKNNLYISDRQSNLLRKLKPKD